MTARTTRDEHQQSRADVLIDLIDRHSQNPLVQASPLRDVLPRVREYILESNSQIQDMQLRIARLEQALVTRPALASVPTAKAAAICEFQHEVCTRHCEPGTCKAEDDHNSSRAY